MCLVRHFPVACILLTSLILSAEVFAGVQVLCFLFYKIVLEETHGVSAYFMQILDILISRD